MLLNRCLRTTLISIVSVSTLLSPVYGNGLLDIEQKLPIEGLSADQYKRAENIIAKFKLPADKNRSCPLESNNYKDLLAKIETIRNLFMDNCMDTDQSRLDEILNGAQTIQSELNAAGVAADSNETVNTLINGDIPVGGDNTISGQQIASVFNNINSVFLNGKCKLDRGSFLEQTADVIQSFATMGMLVPNANGFVVAGGGLALSSILRAIDAIFSDRFDFTEMKDRQTFIKLNCAFYDLRQDIQNSGLVDVSTEEHISFKVETESLLKSIEEKIKAVTKNREEILKAISKAKESKVQEEMKSLMDLGKTIDQALKIVAQPVVDNGNTPATTVKLQMINELTKLNNDLSNKLKSYFSSGLNAVPLLDELLLQELAKLDFKNDSEAYMTLVKEDVKTFNSGFRANLLFHFGRIQGDIKTSKSTIEANFLKNTKIGELSIEKYIPAMEKKTKETLKKLVEMQKPLKVSLKKLQNITSDRDFTTSDDGSENVVNIMDQYNEISSQVYGKWGYEFLEYTTGESENRVNDFGKKFKKFAKNHLEIATRDDGRDYYRVPNPADVSELRTMYACQDAMPFRRIFIHADSLVQQGYDFIETNKRLFHSDVPRGFLGAKSKFRHIQMHHKSSIFAKKLINGEDVDPKYVEKYIEKTYGSRKKKYLGKMMLELTSARPKAELMQKLVDKYKCDSITMDE